MNDPSAKNHYGEPPGVRFVLPDAHVGQFRSRIDLLFDNQLTLMVVLWLATVIPLGGLMVALFISVR